MPDPLMSRAAIHAGRERCAGTRVEITGANWATATHCPGCEAYWALVERVEKNAKYWEHCADLCAGNGLLAQFSASLRRKAEPWRALLVPEEPRR